MENKLQTGQADARAEFKLPWDLRDRLITAVCRVTGGRVGDRSIGGEVVLAFFSELAKDGYGVFPLAPAPRHSNMPDID